jgi:hypothetical protein
VHDQKTFTNRLFKFISVILHPVFFPAILMWLMAWQTPNIFAGILDCEKWRWALIVSYTSVVFPVLVVLLLWKLKFIESIHLYHLKERYAPLIASMLFYFWLFWLFYKQIEPPSFILLLLLSMFICSVAVFMTSVFFKISLHTSGAGHLLSITCIGMILGADNFVLFFSSALLISVLLYISRKNLQAHNHKELISGFLVGMLSVLPAWWIINKIT